MTHTDRAAIVRRMRDEWPSGTLKRVDNLVDSRLVWGDYEFQYRLFELLDDAYNAGRNDAEADADIDNLLE